MQFAKRMDKFGVNIFTTLAAMKAERKAKGLPVIDFSVGSPNIPPADFIIDTLVAAAADRKNYEYAIADTKELRNAVAVWYKRRYGVTLDPDTMVQSLLGSQDGLGHIALAIADEGDVILVPDPCYPVFSDGPNIAGAEIHYMQMRPENNYLIDFSEIPDDVADRAKLMIVSYPNNPTTVLAPDSWYHELIAFAKKHDIIVLHDNAYSELVFDGKTTGSFLAFEGAIDVGVEFNSLSKTYGMAGARVGFCVGNPEVVRMLSLLKSNIDYGMFIPVQKAAVAALTGDQECVRQTRNAYQCRRDVLCSEFAKAGWNITPCEATMFLWPELPAGFTNSTEFVMELLDKTGVVVTPGSAFGPSGEGHVRMALVRTEEEILAAAEAIKASGILNK